jgi:hypothetical protein
MLLERSRDMGIDVVDLSVSAMTVSVLLNRYGGPLVIITAKRRNRPPGLYRRRLILEDPSDPGEARSRIYASLSGAIDVDALIDALSVLRPGLEVELIECEPLTTEGPPSDAGMKCLEEITKYLSSMINN